MKDNVTSLSAEYAYYYLAYPNHCISVTNICTKKLQQSPVVVAGVDTNPIDVKAVGQRALGRC